MNNLDVVIAVLMKHREARAWTDAAVAHELCTQLGLDETAKAEKFVDLPDPDAVHEAEVVALEDAAARAADNAKKARAAFDAQGASRKAGDIEAARVAGEPARLEAEAVLQSARQRDTERLAAERLTAADEETTRLARVAEADRETEATAAEARRVAGQADADRETEATAAEARRVASQAEADRERTANLALSQTAGSSGVVQA